MGTSIKIVVNKIYSSTLDFNFKFSLFLFITETRYVRFIVNDLIAEYKSHDSRAVKLRLKHHKFRSCLGRGRHSTTTTTTAAVGSSPDVRFTSHWCHTRYSHAWRLHGRALLLNAGGTNENAVGCSRKRDWYCLAASSRRWRLIG